MLKFGGHLSNALHEIKRHSGKKISVLMDELGYGFEPELSGDTIESWRYRKAPPTLAHLETLASLIISYKAAVHDREWLDIFLTSAEHPYPQAICDKLFPVEPTQPKTDQAPSQAAVVKTHPPPPLKAYAPPSILGFVGRKPDLTRYKTALEQQTFAAISGMAGVGKTTLMSVLAADLNGQHLVFWHSFANGNIEPLAHRLAGFIANLGRPELWEMLESARMSGGRPPAVDTLFDMLGVILGELTESILLCLDDLQFVDEDVRLQPFLLKMFDHSNVNVLVTTRRYPSFFPAGKEEQLAGLNQAEAAELLKQREVDLQPDLVEQLTEITGGNGAFLTLAAVILTDSREPEEIIGRLAREDDVERFLMEEVNDRLSNSEQRVMEAIAVLSGYPGRRDVVEEMLNVRDVNRTLRGLTDQYLLLLGEDDDGERVYSQHQIIQAFFYDQPRRSRRRELHMKAADFYEFEEPDSLRAMLHHAQAGQLAPLVSIADAQLYDVINQGEGQSLLTILADIEIEGSNLPEPEMIKFWLARGRLQNMLGERKGSEVDLMQGAEMLNRMPQTAETDRLKGEVCLAMGELLERTDPPEALKWVQRGLDIVPTGQYDGFIQLQTLSATLHKHMGNFGAARESLQDGLEQLDKVYPIHQINLLKNLGAVSFHLSHMDDAITYTNRALALSRATGDLSQTARILINAGPINYVNGDWPEAINHLEEGLDIAKRLGISDTQLSIEVNLGRCYIDAGNDEKALEHLQSALDLAKGVNSNQVTTCLIGLADLSIRRGEAHEALIYLEQAREIAKDHNDQQSLATIDGSMAAAYLILKEFDRAQVLINQALHALKLLGDEASYGSFLRVKGQLLGELGEIDQAIQIFEKSWQILHDDDPYEAALTQFAWSKHARDQNQKNNLLNEAYDRFASLGAKRELLNSFTDFP